MTDENRTTGTDNTKKKLPHGTQNTGIDLTGKDVCNIIKACKESGVTELKLGSLQLSFGTTPGKIDQSTPVAEPLPTLPQSEQTDQKLQLTLGDENALKEQFFAQQLIDDPMGFETTIADGFIEKDRVDEEVRD